MRLVYCKDVCNGMLHHFVSLSIISADSFDYGFSENTESLKDHSILIAIHKSRKNFWNPHIYVYQMKWCNKLQYLQSYLTLHVYYWN